MKIPGLRAADELVHGIAHFGRMLDKIRLAQAGTLPEGYFLGDDDYYWWDNRVCRFLGVSYPDLRKLVESGASDDDVFAWCLNSGSKPDEEEIGIFTAFLLKRGWRDESTAGLEEEKQAAGFGDRADILTYVELQKAEES